LIFAPAGASYAADRLVLHERYTFQIQNTPTQRSARWESVLHHIPPCNAQPGGSSYVKYKLVGVYYQYALACYESIHTVRPGANLFIQLVESM
jgi:hypothetical protein